MKVKVFIDGSSGTTGLRIADRLAERPEIELLSISAEGRKDVHERAKVINSADLAFLCLPDAASKEVLPLLRPDVKVLDTSTAFRTDAAWDYGFPELKGQKAKIQNSYRVAVPGCYASGFISIARPLVELGLVAKEYPFSCTGISGYSGGGKKMIADYESPDRPAHSKLDAPKSYGLSLGHKQLEDNPWDTYETLYVPGTVHVGKITEMMDKGAVISLNEGGEGFATPKHLVKEDGTQAQLNEELEFKVIEFVKETKRIILSHSRTFEDVKEEP